MLETPAGRRVLTGAEAELVRQSLAEMVWPFLSRPDDAVPYTEDELPEFGLPLFDSLTETQKLAVIHRVAQVLFDPMVHPPDRNAVFESTIAAVFASIRTDVEIDIGFQNGLPEEDHTARRRQIIDACFHLKRLQNDADTAWNENDVPLPDETDIEEWDFHLDCLLDAILFDRDFELGSGFLDEQPDTAASARSLLGVTNSYFADPAPDISSPDERSRIESELRSLLSPHLDRRV